MLVFARTITTKAFVNSGVKKQAVLKVDVNNVNIQISKNTK